MRLLAVDIGNTNLTLGLFRDGELAGSWRAWWAWVWTTSAGSW